MRIKVHRNVGTDLVRSFDKKGLKLDEFAEGQVVECNQKLGDELVRLGLAEVTEAVVQKGKDNREPR